MLECVPAWFPCLIIGWWRGDGSFVRASLLGGNFAIILVSLLFSALCVTFHFLMLTVGIKKRSRVPGVMITQFIETLPEGKSHPDFTRKPIALTIQEGRTEGWGSPSILSLMGDSPFIADIRQLMEID